MLETNVRATKLLHLSTFLDANAMLSRDSFHMTKP